MYHKVVLILNIVCNQSVNLVSENFDPGCLIKGVQIMAGSHESSDRSRCIKIIVSSVLCQLDNDRKASSAMVAKSGSIAHATPAFLGENTEKQSKLSAVSTGAAHSVSPWKTSLLLFLKV